MGRNSYLTPCPFSLGGTVSGMDLMDLSFPDSPPNPGIFTISVPDTFSLGRGDAFDGDTWCSLSLEFPLDGEIPKENVGVDEDGIGGAPAENPNLKLLVWGGGLEEGWLVNVTEWVEWVSYLDGRGSLQHTHSGSDILLETMQVGQGHLKRNYAWKHANRIFIMWFYVDIFGGSICSSFVSFSLWMVRNSFFQNPSSSSALVPLERGVPFGL